MTKLAASPPGPKLTACANHNLWSFRKGRSCIWLGERCLRPFFINRSSHAELHGVIRSNVIVLAYKNSKNKVRKDRDLSGRKTSQIKNIPLKDNDVLTDGFTTKDGNYPNVSESVSDKNSDVNDSSPFPPRSAVLQACIGTSGVLFGLGIILRQAFHIAFTEGWLKVDTSNEVSFGFEPWHLELILGLVALVSTCRYILLKTWPDFAESSDAANKQVLSSLEPLDYVIVSFLPGISEELLFRGALLPVFGLDWLSALAVGAVFGCLHLGSGRRYSFAIWATFVGFAYGLATVASSSAIVPMAAHSLNNLVGGILWQKASKATRLND